MMNKNENSTDTYELLQKLLESGSFEEFADDNSSGFIDGGFTRNFEQLCIEKKLQKSEVVKRSGLERTYAYQLLRGARKPSRDRVIQLSLALGLDLEETQTLLKKSNFSMLYPRIKRDAAIIFCIDRKLSVDDVQKLLIDIDEEPLGNLSAVE